MDPIRFAAGDVNLYGFVGNNPGNGVDPSGLQPPAARPNPFDPTHDSIFYSANSIWAPGGLSSNRAGVFQNNAERLMGMGHDSLRRTAQGVVSTGGGLMYDACQAAFFGVYAGGGSAFGGAQGVLTIDKNGNVYVGGGPYVAITSPGFTYGGFLGKYERPMTPSELTGNITGESRERAIVLPTPFRMGPGVFDGKSHSSGDKYNGFIIGTPGVTVFGGTTYGPYANLSDLLKQSATNGKPEAPSNDR